MPEITLEVLSLDSIPVPENHCLFTGTGGTVGRDEGNTLVLKDKYRRVSRLHASITFPDNLPTITNASTSLPVSVGTTVLGYGQKLQLSAGELIEIGPFVLRVCAPAAQDTEDAFLAHAQPTILAHVANLPPVARSPSVTGAPVISNADPFPEDFNPFELPSQTSRNGADSLTQVLGGTSQTSSTISSEPVIDALFVPSQDRSFDGLTGDLPPDSLYSPRRQSSFDLLPESSDPLMMFGASRSTAETAMHSPVRDDVAEVGGAFQPPLACASGESALIQGQQKPFPAVDSGASQDALTSAFLKGSGLLPNALPGGLTPEIMGLIGSLLRVATAGAIDMLATRAATKLELQSRGTIISAQSNNPLKFLPNAESALNHMLGKKMPGFMRSDEAMRDAFDDLRAHEIGVIAGTRAALAEVLVRFDPTVLEQRLVGGSLIDSLLPAIRKTKLWEIYLEQYAGIRREAENDFQSVFGRSFLAAYEQETARVKTHASESGKT